MKALLLVFNAALMVCGVCAIVFWLPASEVGVMARYTELDRAGVINESALADFATSYGFSTNARRNVPLYIASPALNQSRATAQAIAGAALLNLLGLGVMPSRSNRDRNAGPCTSVTNHSP